MILKNIYVLWKLPRSEILRAMFQPKPNFYCLDINPWKTEFIREMLAERQRRCSTLTGATVMQPTPE